MIRRNLVCTFAVVSFVIASAASWAASVPSEQEWKVAGPFGGTATAITVDPKNPKVLLAGARNSLLYQSPDAGTTWYMLNFPKRQFGEITSLVVDSSDSQHYFAGMIGTEKAGLFESHDAGKNWTPIHDVTDVGVRALSQAPSDPTHLVAGTLKGVMQSTDGGKSWTRISDTNNDEMQGITAVAIDPKDVNLIYAGTTHLPWRTRDGGKTWESIHTGMIDDSDVFSIYIDPATPDSIFASACSGIYATKNRGDLWQKIQGIPNTHRRTHVIKEDPAQPGIVYAGTTLGLFKSTNKGTNWEHLNETQVNALAFDPASPKTMYLAMEYNGIGRSENSGETISPINTGFVDRRISSMASSGAKLYAVDVQGGDTSSIFVSSDLGSTWQQQEKVQGLTGVHLSSLVVLPSEERIMLGATPHGMYKSINGGQLWKPLTVRLVTMVDKTVFTRIPAKRAQKGKKAVPAHSVKATKQVPVVKNAAVASVTGLYTAKDGTKDLLFAATDLGLLKSTDGGERWVVCDLKGTKAVATLYLSAGSDGRMVAQSPAGLYLSKDFGEHWDQLMFPRPVFEINQVAVPADASAPILVATQTGAYSSPDSGVQWLPSTTGLPASTVLSMVYSSSKPRLAYAVEFGKLYQSEDSGGSWTAVPSSFPSLRIRQLWTSSRAADRLFAITNDLGILFRNEGIIR